jgi:hypothetical protein
VGSPKGREKVETTLYGRLSRKHFTVFPRTKSTTTKRTEKDASAGVRTDMVTLITTIRSKKPGHQQGRTGE